MSFPRLAYFYLYSLFPDALVLISFSLVPLHFHHIHDFLSRGSFHHCISYVLTTRRCSEFSPLSLVVVFLDIRALLSSLYADLFIFISVQIYFKNQVPPPGVAGGHPTHLPLDRVLSIVTDSFTSATERHIEVGISSVSGFYASLLLSRLHFFYPLYDLTPLSLFMFLSWIILS